MLGGSSMVPAGRPRFVTWVLLAAFVAAGPTACASWRKQPAGPDALLKRDHPPRVMRLKLADGSAVEITDPVIRGDSLVGQVKVTIQHENRWDTKQNVDGAVALADI